MSTPPQVHEDFDYGSQIPPRSVAASAKEFTALEVVRVKGECDEEREVRTRVCGQANARAWWNAPWIR